MFPPYSALGLISDALVGVRHLSSDPPVPSPTEKGRSLAKAQALLTTISAKNNFDKNNFSP
jgi:hypothetical protein